MEKRGEKKNKDCRTHKEGCRGAQGCREGELAAGRQTFWSLSYISSCTNRSLASLRWALAGWAVLPANPVRLQSCGSHQETKPSPLLLSLAHKNEVRQPDIPSETPLHTCIEARLERELLLLRSVFQKPPRNPLSWLCGLGNTENKIRNQRLKEWEDIMAGMVSQMWFFSCFPLTEIIYLMEGAQYSPRVTCHKDLVFSTLHPKYYVYISVYYFSLILSI